jgi:hypothetical protein
MWTASAYTVEHSGFGTGGAETIVELKRADNSCSPGRVLAFDNGGPDMKLRMRWDTPRIYRWCMTTIRKHSIIRWLKRAV